MTIKTRNDTTGLDQLDPTTHPARDAVHFRRILAARKAELFATMIDNVEMSLAKTDDRIARRYLALGDRPDLDALVLEEMALTREWVLIVTGKKSEEAEGANSSGASDYIYRGIANRSFERRFALADHIQVRGADLKDGLLAIELVREIPEAMRPRKISLGGGESRTIESDAKPSEQKVEGRAKEQVHD